MKMAFALRAQVEVGAEGPTLNFGLDAIAEGAALEMIWTLGMDPSYTNLSREK